MYVSTYAQNKKEKLATPDLELTITNILVDITVLSPIQIKYYK